MSTKTKLERLAEHYDTADTTAELEHAAAAGGTDTGPSAERMTTFAVRLPVAVLGHVREIAEKRNLTTSALIRRWVEAGIAEDGGNAGGRVVPVQALLELIGRAW
jgi:predicted transcriptional regulator